METGIITNCTRCGQGIKNVFEYQGKPYGCECVQVVSGIKVWEMGDEKNVDEYIVRKAKRLAALEAKELEEKKSREYYYEKNGWLIDYLMDKDMIKRELANGKVIQVSQGGFCTNIANELFYKEIEDLNDKPFNIIVDMWAKDFGGRVGSKKYDKAYDEFFDKAGIE